MLLQQHSLKKAKGYDLKKFSYCIIISVLHSLQIGFDDQHANRKSALMSLYYKLNYFSYV